MCSTTSLIFTCTVHTIKGLNSSAGNCSLECVFINLQTGTDPTHSTLVMFIKAVKIFHSGATNLMYDEYHLLHRLCIELSYLAIGIYLV